MFSPAEAQALSSPAPNGVYSKSSSVEMRTLMKEGAAAAFRQAEQDAKAHLSVAAAKRAEALAKVIAQEKSARMAPTAMPSMAMPTPVTPTASATQAMAMQYNEQAAAQQRLQPA